LPILKTIILYPPKLNRATHRGLSVLNANLTILIRHYAHLNTRQSSRFCLVGSAVSTVESGRRVNDDTFLASEQIASCYLALAENLINIRAEGEEVELLEASRVS
jgi:hypothetical protein